MKWHAGDDTPVYPFEYDHLYLYKNVEEPSDSQNETADADENDDSEDRYYHFFN